MDDIKKITVTSGPYTFQIIDNTLFSRDKTEIYSRNFKIGGTYPDCINVSIIYENNKIIDATMPFLLSDAECSFITPLEKGSGVIIMIKTLLQYVYKEIPTLTYIKFDDKSNIECATEEEIIKKGSRFTPLKNSNRVAVNSSTKLPVTDLNEAPLWGADSNLYRYRKKGTHVKPIPLYYFSIIFNGQTWYEKYFHAKQKDQVQHQLYRKRVNEFLYSPEFKKNMQFDRFVSFFGKKEEEMTELYQYYNIANNFDDFFQSIPKQHRCRLVGPWIEQFMKFIFKDVFYNENWIIPLPLKIHGGSNKARHMTPLKNSNRTAVDSNLHWYKNSKTRKYYCPKGIIINHFPSKNICIDPEDI